MAPAADEHLLVEAPRAAAVLGHLAGPVEGVLRDVAEAPALRRVVVEPFQHDAGALRPADEAADAPVERVDPRRSPRPDRRVVEAQRGAVKGAQADRRLPGGRHLPHVLDRAAAEDPPEVQLTGHGGRAPLLVGPAPLDIPRADETPEQVELLGLPGMRAGAVQHGGEVIGPAGGSVHAAQPTQPAAGRCAAGQLRPVGRAARAAWISDRWSSACRIAISARRRTLPSPAPRSAADRPATSAAMSAPLRRRWPAASALVTDPAVRACSALSASTTSLLTSSGRPATSWRIHPARYSYACATWSTTTPTGRGSPSRGAERQSASVQPPTKPASRSRAASMSAASSAGLLVSSPMRQAYRGALTWPAWPG